MHPYQSVDDNFVSRNWSDTISELNVADSSPNTDKYYAVGVNIIKQCRYAIRLQNAAKKSFDTCSN